jgi:hypothetical protein
MFPVRYELGFYIPEDDILHSHCRENPRSYIVNYTFRFTVDFNGPSLILASTKQDQLGTIMVPSWYHHACGISPGTVVWAIN